MVCCFFSPRRTIHTYAPLIHGRKCFHHSLASSSFSLAFIARQTHAHPDWLTGRLGQRMGHGPHEIMNLSGGGCYRSGHTAILQSTFWLAVLFIHSSRVMCSGTMGQTKRIKIRRKTREQNKRSGADSGGDRERAANRNSREWAGEKESVSVRERKSEQRQDIMG